ncbi:putative disease resistance RPP13-like protein 3 [Setaria italica]|uniref:putative disease resistance RPP13-like protein 3 n=1 Tax=Setaria italica TaxID=4555 RepID=UPI000BE6227E|nr:putative disease resistance RPP13-like protein 3 [Setaria italica]
MEAPISASLGAIGSLIRKLDLLLESSEEVNGCRPRSHKGAKYGMHLLRDDLEEISSYLQDLSELEDPPLIAKCWMKEARELSYDIEDYIDRFVFSGHVASIKTRCRRISHIKIARLVETNKKLIRRKRVAAMISDFRIYTQEAIERHKRYELDCSNFRRRFEPAGRLPTTYEEKADIIIHCGMTKFMDSLDNGRDEQLKVVSVVGSGGIGKTTFVTVLYKKLKGHFDCGAFVRLTRKPDIKTMLRDILTQVQRQQPHHDHGEDPDLIGKIREHLQHKRYLIIIDDLWSASIWDVISHAFPGGGMCSRIIATTQIEDVALACCCYHSDYVFEMRPLDDDLSRKLFFNSLFCSESDFPHKVKEVSNKIIKLCGGSPLATTIIARLLASHPVMLMEQWTYIYDSLSFNLRTCSTSEGLLKLIVNFSYNNLTHHLKTCLLYLSMYPDGCMVCKDDLVKQWVAEGFIDATGGREVGIAESYFHELIARRFLQPADIRYNSEVVSCSVHDVVRDLVVQKSLEENFIMVLDCYRRNVSLSEKVHRLSLHFPHAKYARTNIRSSQVRSLAYFGLSKCMPSIREFKLIRVLNLGLSGHEGGDDTIDLTGISELLQLRYLKVASDVCIELPKHMRRLHYLETLDIGTKITHVPWDIIHLPCLLHLHLPFETNLMDWISAIPASVWSHGKLTNLQYLHLTCSIPVPDHLQRNMEVLGSLLGGHGNLKTLALILGSAHKNVVHSPSEVTFSWDEFAPPLLERFEWLPHIFTFSRVPKWMGKLGNLRILKISMAPVKRIVFDKAGFSALKYFKLICSAVPCLKFEMDTMPNLKRLKLGFSAHRVDQHGTTPISIEHLPGLEEISAKVGNATSSDAETALTAAVSNHPRNPRIRVQLVDWNFCGDGVSYMISKQKEPWTLEEDEILEEGLDKILDHIWSKKRKILDGKKKEDYVRHGGVKRHRKENCTKNVKSRDVLTSPYILGEQQYHRYKLLILHQTSHERSNS